MKKINAFCGKLSDLCSVICCAALSIIVVLTVADIIGRFFFDSSILGAVEIVQMFLTSVFFFSCAVGQYQKGHVHVLLFITKLPKKVSNIIHFIWNVITFATACFMTYAGFAQALYSIEKDMATILLGIPHAPFYILQGIAFLLFTIVLIPDLIRTFLAINNEEYAAEARAYWGE